jgi:hypothetical protein
VVCAAELSRAQVKNFRRVQVTRAVATQWQVKIVAIGMRGLREATAAVYMISPGAKKDNV